MGYACKVWGRFLGAVCRFGRAGGEIRFSEITRLQGSEGATASVHGLNTSFIYIYDICMSHVSVCLYINESKYIFIYLIYIHTYLNIYIYTYVCVCEHIHISCPICRGKWSYLMSSAHQHIATEPGRDSTCPSASQIICQTAWDFLSLNCLPSYLPTSAFNTVSATYRQWYTILYIYIVK